MTPSEFQSSLTSLVAKVDVPWKDATERLARELRAYTREKVPANDQREAILRELTDLLEEVVFAPTLQDLDSALAEYDEFLEINDIEHDDLRERIGTYLFERADEFQRLVDENMEMRLRELQEQKEKFPGEEVEKRTPEELREMTEQIIRTGGREAMPQKKRAGGRENRDATPAKERRDNILPFDPSRRSRQ